MDEPDYDDILRMIHEFEDLKYERMQIYDAEKTLRWSNRRWMRHPYDEGRLHGEGFFHKNFQELKLYPEEFRNFTRMTPQTFDYFLTLVESEIGPQRNTVDAISEEQRLAVTLCYLAHGSQIALLAFEHKIAASTLYKIIPETCQGIYTAFSSGRTS